MFHSYCICLALFVWLRISTIKYLSFDSMMDLIDENEADWMSSLQITLKNFVILHTYSFPIVVGML